MNQQDEGNFFKGLLFFCGLIMFYQIATTISRALDRFLTGLVTIGLVVIAVMAVFFLYRYITDKQYGQTKMLREIEKIEREKNLAASLPKPLREDYLRHCKERQEALFNLKN